MTYNHEWMKNERRQWKKERKEREGWSDCDERNGGKGNRKMRG